MGDQVYCVYIMTNEHHNVLYTGVTSDLKARTWMHKIKMVPGFTKKYNVDKLFISKRARKLFPPLLAKNRLRQVRGKGRSS